MVLVLICKKLDGLLKINESLDNVGVMVWLKWQQYEYLCCWLWNLLFFIFVFYLVDNLFVFVCFVEYVLLFFFNVFFCVLFDWRMFGEEYQKYRFGNRIE